jgi:four helix bundle protein
MAQGRVSNHTELRVWQYAMKLVILVYEHSRTYPSDERFGLTLQIRKAAVSVPANIAEGAARGTTAEFARFVRIAQGSLAELETYLTLASEMSFGTTTEPVLNQAHAVRKMLSMLLKALDNRRKSV